MQHFILPLFVGLALDRPPSPYLCRLALAVSLGILYAFWRMRVRAVAQFGIEAVDTFDAAHILNIPAEERHCSVQNAVVVIVIAGRQPCIDNMKPIAWVSAV